MPRPEATVNDARAMMRFLYVLPFLAIAVACGGDKTDDPDGGGSATACGTIGTAPASECQDLGGCGAGAQNFVKVSFCEHCFARADTHVCEAGTCRALDTGINTNVSFAFEIPLALKSSAVSFSVASINPIMADGTRVTCESLMKSSCDINANGKINARNSKYSPINAQADVIQGFTSADAGEDRLIFVQLTSSMQGTGNLLAWGCTAVDVVQDVTTGPIQVSLTAL